MHPELDRLLDPRFAEGLAGLDMAEVRMRRAACQHREEAVSYLRRVIQVRLDLLGTEMARRQSGEAPIATDELVARLPEILADHGRAPGFGQAPRGLRLPDIQDELVALVDEIVPPGQLSEMSGIGDDDLASLVDRLEALEHEVSSTRHQLHAQIDLLQAEVTRRYRSGEATVDSLLQ
jgi:hypothetical protein